MKYLFALLSSLFLLGAALANQPVDINQADASALADSLTGVGLSKAEAIVAYREQHGPYQHIDELVNVKGIGIRTVDKNRERLLINGQAQTPVKPAVQQ